MSTSRMRSGIAVHKGKRAVDSHFQAHSFFTRGDLHHGDGLPDQVADGDAARFDADFPDSARLASSRSRTMATSWFTLFRMVSR